MNTWCLTDHPGSPIYEMAARLLREDRYFTFGTDTHNAASMPNRIRGLKVAEQIVGADKLHQLTVENPRVLLPDDTLAKTNEAATSAHRAGF